MPGETRLRGPADTAGVTGVALRLDVVSRLEKIRCILHSSSAIPALRVGAWNGGIALTGILTMPDVAAAAPFTVDQTSVLPLAIFGGALSFALLSAFWLIRERARAGEENAELRANFAGLRADRDRLAALVEVKDQRIVVWDGSTEKPKVIGQLAQSEDAPAEADRFLAFGSWLNADSAGRLEAAIATLREGGSQFNISLETAKASMFEAQGRVSGGHAFVRFLPLDSMRSELARLEAAHDRLGRRFSLLDALLEKLPEAFWMAGRDGKLIYANPAYATAVDLDDPEKAIEEDRPLFDNKERQIIQSALADGGHFHGQLPAVVAGDRRMMEASCATNENGSAGIAIDRSDVDAARATLKHTIASHEQTFDHLTTAIAIFDSQQKLQFHNSAFQQLWDLAATDLGDNPSNSDLLEMLRSNRKLPETPDWRKWKESLLSTYQSTGAREESWHLPDGRTLRVIINPQNQGGTSWVFENVTEELALRSNYNSLMRMQGETLDHLTEAVAVFGSDGKVRLTNPAFLTLWGVEKPEDIEGQHVNELSARIEPYLDDAEKWESLRLEITGVRDNRDDVVDRLDLNTGMILDYHLVHLPAGQSMLTFADMTAAANVERALKERNDALEESGALKNRFLQHVSYELRAPLTSIAGFAEILSSDMPGKLNAKQREYLEYISQSSDVLKALIDDVLDLATIDAGAMVLDLDTVDFESVIDECIAMQAEKLKRFRLKTGIFVDPQTDGMIGDQARIRQVLQNLLSNAIEAAPDGSTVCVEVRKQDGSVELSVQDEGAGIPENKLARIFERFESGDGQKRGAGLGLAIVRSLVELHGGEVRIEQGKKRGARFVCVFPYKPVPSRQAAE